MVKKQSWMNWSESDRNRRLEIYWSKIRYLYEKEFILCFNLSKLVFLFVSNCISHFTHSFLKQCVIVQKRRLFQKSQGLKGKWGNKIRFWVQSEIELKQDLRLHFSDEIFGLLIHFWSFKICLIWLYFLDYRLNFKIIKITLQ